MRFAVPWSGIVRLETSVLIGRSQRCTRYRGRNNDRIHRLQEVNRDRDRMSMQIILLANLSRDRNLQLVRSLDLFLRIGNASMVTLCLRECDFSGVCDEVLDSSIIVLGFGTRKKIT